MKGQIFIITSVLILIALFITRISTKTVDIKQDELFYESFSNLKNELIKTIDLALINQESVSDRLSNFTDFSKDIFKKKGYEESVNYSVLTWPTTIVYLNISLSSNNYYLLERLIINRTVYS
jgi:uncharacterized protein YxeA